MKYTAEEIKKSWKKIDLFDTVYGGNYSSWQKDDLLAAIHEKDNEVVIVMNNRGKIVQEDERVKKTENKSSLFYFFSFPAFGDVPAFYSSSWSS